LIATLIAPAAATGDDIALVPLMTAIGVGIAPVVVFADLQELKANMTARCCIIYNYQMSGASQNRIQK
jgi:hypothetical protein